MKRRFTIKSRLILTAVGVFFILIVLGVITGIYVKKAKQNYDRIGLDDAINKNQLKLRKAEKDFIQNEVDNPTFFSSRNSIYITDFDSIYRTVNEQITELGLYKTVKKIIQKEEVEDLRKDFTSYHDYFHKLIDIILVKGFKDFGLVGNMRNKIHEVETQLDKFEDSNRYMVYMLTLRRHEKDYLLRKDLKYRVKFNLVVKDFIAELQSDNDENSQIMIALLEDYRDLFSQVIEKDIQIGLNANEGLIMRLNKSNYYIDKEIEALQTVVKAELNKQIATAVNIILIVALALFSLIALIIRNTSKYIIASIKFLQKYITRLGKGELPEEIKVTKNDEIADMIGSINILTSNLKNTREFAIEVGNGNLEKDVNVFNNEGDLGSSLVEMRKKLLEVARERARNEQENQYRSWISEGVAKFGEILRVNNDNVEKLAYDILSNLIEYLEANQGVLYIMNTDAENQDEHYLELIAAIAYGRKKYIKDKVLLGEDVIGQCAYEKKTIYLTDLPDDYIKITSGLGTSNPRAAIVVPLNMNDQVFGVIELASFRDFEPHHMEFIERIAKNIATTVSHIKINEHTARLLQQAQEQSEEIAAQEEELRQNMEELQATQEESARREFEINQSLDAINSNVYIATLDLSGNIQQINEAMISFLNLPEEHILQKQFASFFSTDRTSNEFIQLWVDLRQGKSRRRENMAVIKDEVYYLNTTYIPLEDKEGKVINVLAISYDITETVKLKKELHKLKSQKSTY